MLRVAVSIGDLNGIGIEIALKAHNEISKIIKPVYFINQEMLELAAKKLGLKIPKDFEIIPSGENFKIKAGKVSKKAGKNSFLSFANAFYACKNKTCDALLTLPINKDAWQKAGISYVGHTDALSDFTKKEAIMMLGCPNGFFSILYTDHMALKDVSKKITTKKVYNFLIKISNLINEKIAILGFNPHSGENGLFGQEDIKIKKAIKKANLTLNKEQFYGTLVPDTAFTPHRLKEFKYFICFYHDQGLIPLKTLFFDDSINVSLGLDVFRVSVDHGTAFDIAYKNKNPSLKSYINAAKFIRLSL